MIDIWANQVIKECGISCQRMDVRVVDAVFNTIISKFARKFVSGFIWEYFEGDVSVCLDNAAEQAVNIVGVPAYLLYEEGTCYYGMCFDKWSNLSDFVKNMPRFEFYLTDVEVNFVVCRNHHDYLIGVGAIVDRIENIASLADEEHG